jgi:hypothetical protein
VHIPRIRVTATVALVAAYCVTSAHAQDDSANAAHACINSSSIHHTKVLDDRTILFFMRDRSTYRNTLVGTCPGLNSEQRFMYGQSSLNTVCKGSVINVVVYAFGEVTRGASCWLGSFEQLSGDEVEELLALSTASRNDRGANRRHAIKAEPVELPPTATPSPSAADTAQPAPQPEKKRSSDNVETGN